MASAPKLTVVAPSEDPLLKQFNKRLDRAETDFNRHRSRIADCYKYAAPWRHKISGTVPSDDLDEIFDSEIMTVQEDFSADMLNTFTPQKNNWLEEVPVKEFDAGDRNLIGGALKKRQDMVFFEMARSPMYQALQEAYLDLAVGTMCLMVQDTNPAAPIHCEAIAATDVRFTRGPFGMIDGYFRPKKSYMQDEIQSVWPDADMSVLPVTQDPSCAEVEIADGCWRDWTDRGSETYHYLVRAGGKRLYYKTYQGAGSCPFIAARWSRDATTAHGVGPTYRSLPDIKTLNHLRYLDLKNYDKHVDPITSYEDDGVVNVDQGLTPGTWVPRAVGSKAPESLESKARLDLSSFERDELRSSIRRAHYQDRPEQIGKTPPTATQWADEAAERARRMGTPATNLVLELQIPLYKRFVYILTNRGRLPKVLLNNEEVSLQPVSPLLRAQQQEEVVRNDKFAELIIGRFGPQIGMIVINVVKYANKQGLLLGVDKELIRDEKDIQNAIEQLMPVLKATGVVPAAGAPTAPPVGLVAGQ